MSLAWVSPSTEPRPGGVESSPSLISQSTGLASARAHPFTFSSPALKTVTSQIGPESLIAPTVVEKLAPKLLAQLDAVSHASRRSSPSPRH